MKSRIAMIIAMVFVMGFTAASFAGTCPVTGKSGKATITKEKCKDCPKSATCPKKGKDAKGTCPKAKGAKGSGGGSCPR